MEKNERGGFMGLYMDNLYMNAALLASGMQGIECSMLDERNGMDLEMKLQLDVATSEGMPEPVLRRCSSSGPHLLEDALQVAGLCRPEHFDYEFCPAVPMYCERTQ